MRYRLAIFDFDGTLADSFPFFTRVFNQLAQRHGFKELDSDLAPSLRGYSARQMMNHVGMPSWKLPFVAKDFIALMRENVAAIKPFADVDDVLSHLVHGGVAVAIVSSNSYDNVSAVLGTPLQFPSGPPIHGHGRRAQARITRNYGESRPVDRRVRGGLVRSSEPGNVGAASARDAFCRTQQ